MSKNKKNKKFNKNMNPTEKNQPQDEEVLKNTGSGRSCH